MEVIVIDSKAFEQLKLEITSCVQQALADFLTEQKSSASSDWIPLAEAKKLLPYKSKSTWQKLRDRGIIEFSQSPKTRNILYSRESILKYLNKNHIKQ